MTTPGALLDDPPPGAALDLDEVLTGVPRIHLPELTALPDLQTRVDRKYVVPADVVRGLLAVHGGSAVLEIDGSVALRYESVYFDSADLACFRAAATRRRRRFKVRTRTYLDTGVCLLEAKTVGGRGQTVKRRAAHPVERRAWLGEHARAVLGEWLGPDLPVLVPALTTTYRRSTLVDRVTGERVTIDTDVRATTPDGRGAAVCAGGVVETKALRGATATDRWLWAHGYRPTRISKYAVGLAVLTPELRANVWHRAVQAARG